MAPTTVLTARRAPCPACMRSVPVTEDGRLARHHNLSTTMLQRTGAVCMASGLEPGHYAVVPVAMPEVDTPERADLA